MISGLATTFFPSFGSAFTSDSPALASPAKETVKTLDDTRSPIIQMSEFFASIDSGIIKLVNIAKQSLGLDKRSIELEKKIADIMASDLALEKKQDLVSQLKGRDANLEGQDTDKDPGEKPKKINFIDSLKEALAELSSNQTIGEVLKIFALATGALALAKLASKFSTSLAPVLKFIKETLIPSVKELDEDIKESESGYLGTGGLSKLKLFATLGAALGGITFAISKFLVSPLKGIATKIFGAGSKLRKGITAFNLAVLGPRLGVIGAIGRFFNGILPTIKKISGAFTRGLSAFSKLTGLSFLLRIGGLFLRFIAWPLQLVIGLFGGLTEGLKKFKEGGGMFEVLGAFMKGVYNAIVGATLNLIADIAGWVVKKLGFTKLGESIQNLDFSFDSIMRGVINLKNSILNFITKGINQVRKFFGKEPYKLREMIKADSETDEANLASITENKQSEKKLVSDEVNATTNEIRGDEIERSNVDLPDVPTKFAADTEALAKSVNLKKFTSDLESDFDDGMKSSDFIKLQNQNAEILKEAAAENAALGKESTSKPIIVQDNKVVKGGDTVSNTIKTSSPIHVEHRDQTAKALNFYMFGNAHA